MGNTELHGRFASEIGRSISESETEGRMLQSERSDTVKRMGYTEHQQHEGRVSGHREESGENSERAAGESARPMQAIGLGDTEHAGQFTSKESRSDATPIRHSKTGANSTSESEGTSTSRIISEWTDPDWLYCRDEKYRPIKSGIEPLANGLSRGMGYSSDPSEPIDPDNTQEARVMRLKGYGNAIVPQVAASFIKAFMEAT
jgi:DNA (cytosine-5)-methyltransferase 1